jgi:ribose-phosphate pyrophosphokinase
MSHRYKIFSGNSNIPLAKKVCDYLGVPLSPCEIKKFSNDNIMVRYPESIRGDDVYIIQTSSVPVNEGLMELLIMVDAAKHASAGRIIPVLPYYPYARSDKKDKPRISITARLVADLLEVSGADRVITMDLHSTQIQGFFRIPVDEIRAGSTIVKHYKTQDLTNAVVVAPDAGSAKRAAYYAENLNLPFALLDKRRYNDLEQPEIQHVIGDVTGKKAIIFDDEIASGGSIVEVVKALNNLGVKEIEACCVHGVLSGNAVERIQQSSLSKLVITDTVAIPSDKVSDKITVLSVSGILAKAILHTYHNESISGLFDTEAI